MEVVLAHPEGYEVMPEVEEIAKKQAEESGGSFRRTNDMKDCLLYTSCNRQVLL